MTYSVTHTAHSQALPTCELTATGENNTGKDSWIETNSFLLHLLLPLATTDAVRLGKEVNQMSQQSCVPLHFICTAVHHDEEREGREGGTRQGGETEDEKGEDVLYCLLLICRG